MTDWTAILQLRHEPAVTPAPAGHVTVRMAKGIHSLDVHTPGADLGNGLMVHQLVERQADGTYQSRKREWAVSHVASGKQLAGYLKNERAARAVAAVAISTGVDWTAAEPKFSRADYLTIRESELAHRR
jgi:hypothetical protein